MGSDRVFRVFLSSTFGDFRLERQALQSIVFPRLERYCAEQGGTYQAVDLRWGISERARKSHETMRICLQEIRRCQELSPRPNFVALVGNRYGWQPVPAYIPIDQWRRLIAAAQLGDQEIIRSAYSEEPDLNPAIPVFCLKTSIDTTQQKAVLRSALERAASRAGFNELEALNYFASATHHEIIAGALSAEIQDQRVHIYMRKIHGLPINELAKEYIDWDETTHMPRSCAQKHLEDMKNVLNAYLPQSIHGIDAWWGETGLTDVHIQEFCDTFYRHQIEAIDRELESSGRPREAPISERRERLHSEFAKERTRHFTGRKQLLGELKNCLSFDQPGGTYAIIGEGGCGKSALIARLAEDCGAFGFHASLSDQSVSTPPLRLCRFVGGGMGSRSSLSLLDELTEDLCFKGGFASQENCTFSTSHVDRLVAAVEMGSRKRPVWILIDGLDQIQNGQEIHEFLRRARWPNVSVVVSGRNTYFPARDLSSFTRVFEVPPMTCEDGSAVVDAWLADRVQLPFYSSSEVLGGRRLTNAQRAVMLTKFSQSDCAAHGNPLWLKLAFEDAVAWRSFDPVPEMPDSIEGLVERFVVSKLLQREALRPTFSMRALAYISAGRFGLSDRELSRCLSMDEDVLREFHQQERLGSDWDAETLPPILWSRLFFELRPFLSEIRQDGSVLYRYFHIEFERAIKRVCADLCPVALMHSNLADVMESLAPAGQHLFEKIALSQFPDPHAMRFVMEQPWQLAHAGKSDALANLLMNFTFCMSKCATNEADDLVDDFDLANERASSEALVAWRAFFFANAHLLRRGNQAWPAHKILLQVATEQKTSSCVNRAGEEWAQQGHCDWLWIRRVGPRGSVSRTNSPITLEGHTGYVRGALQHPGGPIISWGQDSTLRVWEQGSGRCLAMLEGHSAQILGTGLISEGRCFSWSEDNTIRLWDVSGGYEIGVLRGHQDRINGCIAIESGRLISWSEDGSIRVWDLNSCSSIAVLGGHTVGVSGVFPLGSDRVVSWSSIAEPGSRLYDCGLRVWDLEALTCKFVLRGHEKSVSGAIQLSNGTLLSWSDDCTLRIWNVDSGSCLAVLSGFTGLPPEGVIETASGDLVSWNMGIEYECRPGLDDGPPSPTHSEVPEVMFWRRDNAEFKAKRITLSSEIAGIIQREDGNLLSWRTDGTFSIWEPTEFTHIATFGGGTPGPIGVRDSSGGTFVSWHRDGALRTWDINERICTEALSLHTGAILGFLTLEDGRRLSWGSDGNLRVSTIWADTPSSAYPALLARYNVAVLSPQGQILAVNTDHNVDVFDSRDGQKITELKGHCDPRPRIAMPGRRTCDDVLERRHCQTLEFLNRRMYSRIGWTL
jgi:WD40 repeat protein